MARLSRWAILLALSLFALGCGQASRPYLNDPLLRTSSPVRGDPSRTLSRELRPPAEPLPPRPPEPDYLPDVAAEASPPAPERACYFPAMGVNTTVPLSCPVNTALPSFAKAMQ